jgi:hypothetical protein
MRGHRRNTFYTRLCHRVVRGVIQHDRSRRRYETTTIQTVSEMNVHICNNTSYGTCKLVRDFDTKQLQYLAIIN